MIVLVKSTSDWLFIDRFILVLNVGTVLTVIESV